VLPAVSTLAAACTVPTLLGYWKTEYGVSYAYGSAMAACGALTLMATGPLGLDVLAKAHALVLVMYGVRLNTFLLYREVFIPRFRDFREKIEARTKKQGGRLKRTPFVLGCSALYYCMGAPLKLTAAASTTGPARALLAIEVALMYAGFAVAAIGDLQKTIAKADRGENSLVTSGLFRYLRHPNYTGELLLWASSAAAALTAAPAALASGSFTTLALVGWLLASCTGFAGIGFVLMNAATGLEKKQKEKYGARDDVGGGPYEKWVASTWAGPTK
jgi:steroid 5-alpha reductase family enzyme